MATIIGTTGDDYLPGTSSADHIEGKDGNDHLTGYGGNDLLAGGPDRDYLFGFGGNDRLEGGKGPDYLSGDSGSDSLFGSGGADVFRFTAVNGTDHVTDFKGSDGDKLLLDIFFPEDETADSEQHFQFRELDSDHSGSLNAKDDFISTSNGDLRFDLDGLYHSVDGAQASSGTETLWIDDVTNLGSNSIYANDFIF